MKSPRLLAAVVLVATFLGGAVAGAGVHHALRPRPPLGPFDLPERELKLTDEQRLKLDEVMTRHQPQIQQVMGEVRPKLKGIAEEIRGEVRALLTDEQRAVLDRLEKEHGGPPPLFPPPRRPGMGPPGPLPPGPGPGPLP